MHGHIQDFAKASRIDPANNATKEELKKVAALIQNEKSKVRVSCFSFRSLRWHIADSLARNPRFPFHLFTT